MRICELYNSINHFWVVTVNQVKAQNVDEVDRFEEDDVQCAAEYLGPILKNMQDMELKN